MSSAPHQIRRQQLVVRAGTPAEAFALRQGLRARWEAELLPAIERAFDRGAAEAGAEDRVVRIPRLEVTLRVSRDGELAEVLPSLVEDALAESLRARLREAVAAPQGARELARGTAAGAHTAAVDASGASSGDDGFATLAHYLRTGSLPWPASSRPPADVVAELRALCRTDGERLAALVLAEPAPSAFHVRLLHLLGACTERSESVDAEALVARLSPRVPARWRAALEVLLSPAATTRPAGTPTRSTRLAASAALLAEATAHPVDDSPAAIAAAVRRSVNADEARAVGRLLDDVLGPRATGEPRHAIGSVAAPPARDGDPATGASNQVADARVAEPSRTNAPHEGPESLVPRPSAERAEAFAAPAVHAGLVLLHPYIGRLFAHLGLTDGKTLVPDQRSRAAALLHLLATGRDEAQELELGFVKLLLGVADHEPLLVAEGALHADDREEADALLLAVREHWGVLKGTSPDGLRRTFLQRGGLLRRVDGGWRLDVEPAPFDVLLTHLPWSVAVVRFPWMPEPVYVEWPTP